jgi:hypothetical protein
MTTGGAAIRPIWRNSPRSSRTAQCSRTISSSTRNRAVERVRGCRHARHTRTPREGVRRHHTARVCGLTTAKERLVGVTGIVGHLQASGALRPGLSFERARDILWTLIAWEVYELLVIERGLSLDDWESWIAESGSRLVTPIKPSAASALQTVPAAGSKRAR